MYKAKIKLRQALTLIDDEVDYLLVFSYKPFWAIHMNNQEEEDKHKVPNHNHKGCLPFP